MNQNKNTSRERVQQALAHQQPYQTPFSWGLHPTPEMTAELDAYLRQRGMSWRGLFLATEDTIRISPRYNGPPLPEKTDIWGIVRKKVSYGEGAYDEIDVYPLADAATPADINTYPWPDPEWFDYTNLRQELLVADPAGRLAGKLWIDVCGNPFEIYTWMTGHERTFTNLVLNSEVVHAAMERITQFFEAKLRYTLPLVADRVDICYFADDLGGQKGLLMSPESYRQVIMPYHQRLFRVAKEISRQIGHNLGGPAIMLHSDGSVFDLLPDLIDAGVEVLEAVQVDAAKMDPKALKDAFGEVLAFHGGISVQSLLPHETVITVKAECRKLVDELGKGGGYIASPTHCIQMGTPPENVMAILVGVLGAKGYTQALQEAKLEEFRLELNTEAVRLQLPVRNGAEKVIFCLERSGGQRTYEFEIELALGEAPDWWAGLDVRPSLKDSNLNPGFFDNSLRSDNILLRSKTASIHRGSFEWLASAIQQADGLLWADDLYKERLRPQLHFTPRRGWNNDPNGLFFYEGAWHMFFQHNPYGTTWGNMHWGHAISRDLVHWEELPIALYQQSLGDMAFSGSGVAGIPNISVLTQQDENLIVLFFTSTGRGECIATSSDGGQTFREYEGNPLITHQGRDPKVIWYPHTSSSNPEGDGHWVMVVYEELVPHPKKLDEIGYAFYVSKDMITWRRTDFLPGFWECPELFELEVCERRVWTLYGAVWQGIRSAFVLGDFDGERFSPISNPIQAHLGPHFYAAQTFSNAPDGRRIMIGWLCGAAYPEMPFSQGMTVPLELSLRLTNLGLRLCFNPVRELESLRTNSATWQELNLGDAEAQLNKASDELLDMSLWVVVRGEQLFEFEIGDQVLSYNAQSGDLIFGGRTARLAGKPETLMLRILVDRSVAEVFAQDGEAAFASMVLFRQDKGKFRMRGEGLVKSLDVHGLRSIWGT